ncbi:methionine ABC transporter ATP-binding protein [Listeria riparia]|uniref:ABC transporter n=1 Tax=Listeria riparia FSL S10-1204 TaxID=1265816 RepID=W7D557_9LIST|nr:methionine ABC transporter ATP-binding protein [Listeria riparia]EUJ44312.1 ABC transporter [Listeria riparia FSL S10-1204]
MIEFKDVTKTFKSGGKEITALDGVSLTIEKGDIFGVVGLSGAGKSTLIRTVNLLERPTTGSVTIAGTDLASLSSKDLRAERKKIGMIFQHFNLLNSKTVFDNIAVPLALIHTNRKEREKRVMELLAFVGLADKAKNYPDQLSGGQKQRIGIARALATNPDVLLCDEATSALDPETTGAILELLKKINKEYNITILLITHEMSVIREICNRVAVMEGGKVIEEGNVFDIFSNPKSQTARNFVKTVINDDIPASVWKLIQNHNATVWKFTFVGESSGNPLLSNIAKQFGVNVSVLSGNISEIQDIAFGYMIVEVTGDAAEIAKAYEYAATQNVKLEEVTVDGSYNGAAANSVY